MLSQMHDEVLKSVVFFFRKINSTKCNYMIYDKELLAIINSFENWKFKLIEAHKKVKILFDHQNLEYFMITKKLNRRQVRWAELLSKFNFKIKFRSEKQSAKPNVLTRRFQNLPKGIENERTKYQKQTILKLDQTNREIALSLKLNVAKFSTKNPNQLLKELLDKAYMNNAKGYAFL